MMKNAVSLAILVVAGLAPEAIGQCGDYTQRIGPSSPVFEHQIAYDPVRQQLVMFGGNTSLSGTGLTFPIAGYILGSDGWRLTPVAPRGPRWGHVLTWDPSRAVVQMTGGMVFPNTASIADGTWSWNGSTWTQGRNSFVNDCLGAYFDQAQSRVVVVGPSETGYVTESGFFYITTGQSLRRFAAFAYDANRQRAVVHGGSDSSGNQNDETWEFDGVTWMRVSLVGPGAREDHAMVYDPVRQKVVLHGGLQGTATLSDTWTWDGQQWEQLVVANAQPRRNFAMFWDPRTQRVNIHGGLSTGNQILGSMRELAGNNWTETDIGLPPSQVYSPMGYDSSRDFGLLCAANTSARTTYLFQNGRWTVSTPMPSPTPSGLVMAFDSSRGVMVAIRRDTGETWLFDGLTWTTGAMYPSGGNLPTLAIGYDPQSQRVVAHSRRNVTNTDTAFAWDGQAWASVPAIVDNTISTRVMATDSRRGFLYLYTGKQVFRFVNSSWQLHSDLVVPPLSGAVTQLTYDGRRDRLVIHHSNGLSVFAYEFDGQAWVNFPFLGTVGSIGYTDTRRHRRVGLVPTSGYMLQTRTSVDVTTKGPTVKPCAGGTALLSVLVGAQGAQQYQWYRDSTFELLTDGVSASGTVISGATTPTLTLGNVTPGDLGAYFCRVTNACGPTDSFPITVVPDVCIAEFNCDGQISPTDIFDYLNAWFAGDQSADVDGAAGLAASDIFAFLNAWFSGC